MKTTLLKKPAVWLAACLSFTAAFAASGPEAKDLQPRAKTAAPPEATVKVLEANYCFAKFHGISPERLPTPPMVLRLKLQVSYANTGTRPLILPLDHALTVYTAQKPGLMKILPQPAGLLDPALKTMEHLPANVNPKNPVDPMNDVFGIVPAGGEMKAPLIEELSVFVYKKSIRQKIDLRGRQLYLKLQLDHQPLSPQLEAAMSDNWSRYGVPWTGRLRTNTLLFNVPATPSAAECVDEAPLHSPHKGIAKLQGAGK